MEYLLDFDLQHGRTDVRLLEGKLLEIFTYEWMNELNKVQSKCGTGLNKLRTF